MIIPFGVSIWPAVPAGDQPCRSHSKSSRSGWPAAYLGTGGQHPNVGIIAEIAVWRAANAIHPSDPRPTGAGQLQTASALWQHHLERSLARGSDDNIGHLDIP
jgi:hypothetical protein